MNQIAILSNVTSSETETVIDKGGRGIIYHVAPSRRGAPLIALDQVFLRDKVVSVAKVLDAKRDCGAKGDGVRDDTIAIQRCLDGAHKERQGTVVYFPSGTYRVSKTLEVRPGASYKIEGTGWHSRIIWSSSAAGTVLHIHDPDGLSIEHITLGGPDGTTSIRQTGSVPSTIRYHNVFGYYDDETREERIVFDGLPVGTLVLAEHLDGRVTIKDSSQATILLGFLVSVQMMVEGTSPQTGYLGILSRVSALEEFPLVIRDNQSLVMTDWYNEQTRHLLSMEGDNKHSGHIIIDHTQAQTEAGLVTKIEGYTGLLAHVGGMFGRAKEKEERFILMDGDEDIDILLIGNIYWHKPPKIYPSSSRVTFLGNSLSKRGLGPFAVVDNKLNVKSDLEIGVALDAFRTLGAYDLALNYCIME